MLRAFGWYCLLFCLVVMAIPLFIVKSYIGRPSGNNNFRVVVFETEARKLWRMGLEDYVARVLAAEMPAKFPPEALKAQAVAIRTFALEKMSRQVRAKYGPGQAADFTDRPGEGQAWINEKRFQEKWGDHIDENWSKICQAVRETQSEVIVYKGKLIEAYYHSTCGSYTENAASLWGVYLPYLQSKKCVFDTESPRYREVKRYSWSVWCKLTGLAAAGWKNAKPVTKNGQNYCRVLEKTTGGRIKKISLGGRIFTGDILRQKLSLASANCSLNFSSRGVIVTTQGYGHGVGLCQYGARGLALKGYSYQQILRYYYTGVQIVRIRS